MRNKKMIMPSDRDAITELKIQNENMSKVLECIQADIKELVKMTNGNNTCNQLLEQRIKNTEDKIKDIEPKISSLEKNQSWLLAKVGAISTIITGVVTWLLKM